MNKEKIIVGFLTSTDPKDKTSWSGTHYQMLNHLKKNGLKVKTLGPIKKPKFLIIALFLIDISHIISGKRFNKNHNILSSKYFAWYLNKKLNAMDVNVIFSATASTEIAYLKTSIPICYLSDTSFSQIQDYYQNSSNFSQRSIKQSNLIEQKAINNSATQVYPSEWAANHVIKYYKAIKDNVFVVKFGANFDAAPPKTDLLVKGNSKTLNLFFLGLDWKRKGGDIAFEAFNILLSKGYDVKLTVCGCVPPISHKNMTVIPYLNKNNDVDNKKLIQLFHSNDIFFLPTRSECYGIVFCEAAAFGLPVITTATGGVTSVIENGINGYALPLDATANDYAIKIEQLFYTPNKLNKMAISSREKFEQELNWDVWAKKLIDILLFTIKNKDAKH